MIHRGILPEERRKLLRKEFQSNKHIIRLLEAHNGLSAILASDASVNKAGEIREFDGLWISGLTENLSRGLPDIELQGMSSRIGLIREIVNVTHKPIVVDGDTGGTEGQLQHTLKMLEILGVSGLIIEDKVFPKNNSLDGTKSQTLEDPEKFANKIRKGKESLLSKDFMLIARLEALIAGKGIEEAISRAERYILAGADGIVIHSSSKSPDEILAFAQEYRKLSAKMNMRVPLICIPTTYNSIKEKELEDAGFNLVIYANHLLRSAYNAMLTAAESILTHERSLEIESECLPIVKMFELSRG